MELEVYYENSEKNKKIVFDEKEYGISDFDLFRHEFKYSAKNDKIENFTIGITERKVEVTVTGNKKKSWQELYDEMNGVFDRDVLLKKPGRLYVNKSYIPCFFVATTPAEMFEDWGFQTAELKVVTDTTMWVEEQTIGIDPITNVLTIAQETSEEKKYPYKYPYRYPMLETQISVYVDHCLESDFELKIYGPTLSVSVNIANHPYKVEYPIEEGEYMVIDSRSHVPKEERLYLVKKDGGKENIFNYRNTEYSVFKKIPPGNVVIDYSRAHGIDLTIFKERSEPAWTSSH